MTTNNGSGASVFARYIDSPPEKEQPTVTVPRGPMLQPVVPSTDYKSPPIERMIEWLVHRWPKETVNTKNILQFGPRPLRNRKNARATAEILVTHGWLTPLKTRRYMDREWRIERGPSGLR
jgi:hypothetical protein